MHLLEATEAEAERRSPRPSELAKHPRARQIVACAVLLVPAVLVVWMGWRHRWTADDGFINLRIVRHIVDGHGPVFNTGQRVEVGTSPLWLAVLSLVDLVTPFRLEWIAAISALATTGGALVLAVFATRRASWSSVSPGVVLLPLGALVYAALPPSWDFATSGLENGLGLLWIATCWWLVCSRIATARFDSAPRWWVPVVLSLGPLVRPDFAVFSVAFLVALIALCERRLVTIGRLVAWSAVVPVVTELARMAYYGDIVPNTAVAKEAALPNWSQGWSYLVDYVSPYLLTIPIMLLLAWWLVAARRSGGIAARPDRVVGLVVVAGALLHGLYVVRVGGDFMHARMLLPTTFVMLLPVSIVAVRGRAWCLAVAIVGWAIACGLWMRPPYSAAIPSGMTKVGVADPFDEHTGIADERLYWVRSARTAHPVTIDDYLPTDKFARDGQRVARWAADGRTGLLLDVDQGPGALVPLRPGVHAPIVVSVDALGIFSYAAGDDVDVVDAHGLASPLASHQHLGARGRPGHEKLLADSWVVAQYADPHAGVPSGVQPNEEAAARRALACEPLRRLLTAPTRPLTVDGVLDNLTGAVATSTLRFPPDPAVAARAICGH